MCAISCLQDFWNRLEKNFCVLISFCLQILRFWPEQHGRIERLHCTNYKRSEPGEVLDMFSYFSSSCYLKGVMRWPDTAAKWYSPLGEVYEFNVDDGTVLDPKFICAGI